MAELEIGLHEVARDDNQLDATQPIGNLYPAQDDQFPHIKTYRHILKINEKCQICKLRVPNIAEHHSERKCKGPVNENTRNKVHFKCQHCDVMCDLFYQVIKHIQTDHTDKPQPKIYQAKFKTHQECLAFRTEIEDHQGQGFTYNTTGTRIRFDRPNSDTSEMCICKRSTCISRNADGSKKTCMSFVHYTLHPDGTCTLTYNREHGHEKDDYTKGRKGRKHAKITVNEQEPTKKNDGKAEKIGEQKNKVVARRPDADKVNNGEEMIIQKNKPTRRMNLKRFTRSTNMVKFTNDYTANPFSNYLKDTQFKNIYTDGLDEKLSSNIKIVCEEMNYCDEVANTLREQDMIILNARPYYWVSEYVYASPELDMKATYKPGECECDWRQACKLNSGCLNRLANMDCMGKCSVPRFCKNNNVRDNKTKNVVEVQRKDARRNAVLANEAIKRGEFIMSYYGEVITNADRSIRQATLETEEEVNWYFMNLTKNRVVDAQYIGNESRNVNHHCEPNTQVEIWICDGREKLALIASRNIQKGEEITIKYGWTNNKPCLCGSQKCKRVIT